MRTFLALLTAALMAVPAWAQVPATAIVLGSRHGHGTPHKTGCARTAGGNIYVTQPSANVVVVTMSGAVAATGHPFKHSVASMHFDLNQEFQVVFTDPLKVQGAKLYLETSVIGLLRTGGHCAHKDGAGTAEHGEACALVRCGSEPLMSVCIAPHGVACGDKLSINCQEGPVCVPVLPGCYALHGRFHIQAAHAHCLLPCKAASAEFAPDALDPLWFGHGDPFRGAATRDFGFQITLRVVPE